MLSCLSKIQSSQSFAVELSVPQNFKVMAYQNYNQLDWKDNNDSFTYTLIEKSVDQGDFYPIAYLNKGINTYKDYSVLNGHVYTYRLKTYSGNYSSPYTPQLEAITLYPINLNITNVYKNQVDLEWYIPTLSLLRKPEYKTIVERRMINENIWRTIATLPVSETSFRDTDVKDDTYYYYRIRMHYDADRYSRYIPSDSGINTRTPNPLTTSLWGYGIPNGSIRLMWDMSKAGNSRVILERKDSTGNFTAIHTSYNSSFVDIGRMPGETYTYRLCMQTPSGYRSEYTDEVRIAAEVVPTPSDLVVNAISTDQIVLSWAYPYEVETGFEIWRKNESTEDQSFWILVATVAKNTEAYSDKSTQYGETYTYKIRAIRGNTAFSDFSQNQTVINDFPEVPKPLLYYTTENLLHIYSYDKVPENTIYTLEFREDEYGPWKDRRTATSGYLKSFVSYGPSSEYYFRLRANIGTLESVSSEFHFFGAVPQAPANLNATHVGYSRVILKWDDKTEKERGYNIYRTANGVRKHIGSVDKNVETFIDTAPLAGVNTYYEVIAYNLIGESGASGLSVKIPSKVLIKDIASYKWAHDAIYTLQGLGALGNQQSEYFYPQNAITRGQLAHIILKSFNIQHNFSGLFPLTDITANHVYYKDLATAVHLGLMHPDLEGRIYPQKTVTRKEVMLILSSVLGYNGYSLNPYSFEILERYSDYEQIAPEEIQIISSFVGDGILTGKSGQTLGLSSNTTKVEVAAFIYRTLKKYKLN